MGSTTLRDDSLVGTGIEGLDDVLGGGLTPNRLYLLEGVPGSGKTTIALQFLLEGHRLGESGLYVTLSESEAELHSAAASHGWRLEGIVIREIVPSEKDVHSDEQYTVFYPTEIELAEMTRSILSDVERTKPVRVVIDSLSELRLLSGGSLQYRRQLLALKQFFMSRQCTVMLLDDLSVADQDLQVQSIVNGVVRLEQQFPDYGANRRRLRVVKYRGRRFRGGYHDYSINRGGLDVYPRLVAAEHRRSLKQEQLESGLPQFDLLLGGGIERGTSTLIVGAAGTGKSTVAMQMAAAAAARGESAGMFLFDEGINTLLTRAAGIGINLEEHMTRGRVLIQQVDPAELSPGEFSHRIRRYVEETRASLIVIDSLNGYLQAMPEERFLIVHLHELLSYLGQQGVATLVLSAHQGLIGEVHSTIEASYLADAILLLRFFELRGEIRQAISLVKKRSGRHERTIREFRMDGDGIHIGEPLRDLHGVLRGTPEVEAAEQGRRP